MEIDALAPWVLVLGPWRRGQTPSPNVSLSSALLRTVGWVTVNSSHFLSQGWHRELQPSQPSILEAVFAPPLALRTWLWGLSDLDSNLKFTKLARECQASHLTSVFLGFLTCKVGLITVLTSWSHFVMIK